MFPASSKGGGQCFVYPDVCKTPAPPAPFIPVPYPDQAPPLLKDSKKTTKTKVVQKKAGAPKGQVDVMKTKRAISSGDEAGVLKGIASTTQGKALIHRLQTQGFSASGAKLMVEGQPLVSSSDQILLRSFLSKR